MKHVMLKYMYVQDVVEKKLTNLAYISTKQNKADLMTKCHTSEAHKRGLRDDRIETRLKQTKEVKMQREKKSISSDEEEMRTRSFSVKFSARVFYQCQVNLRLVTILTSQVFFKFFMNLDDRDLTEHQITQTLTLSRLDAQTGADKGNPTVHSNKLSFVCCLLSNAVRSVRICGVTSWNGSMTNTAWLRSTHRRCFSWWNLVWIGKCGELEQIVNIPVTQIVGRDHRGDYSQFHRMWKRSQK